MSDFIGTKLTMNLGERSYDIILKNGALENLYQFARLDRRVAVVTDAGVPAEYAQRVADQCRDAKIITVPQGEASKSMKLLESVLRQMLEFNMGRGDLVIAVGGGAIMDLCKLLEVNDSATNMVHAVANLELVLKDKLEFVSNNLYYPSADAAAK